MPKSKSLEKRREDCKRKHQFKSRKDARIAAQRATSNAKTKVYFYKCRLCGYRHLTRNNPKWNYEERQRAKIEEVL